MPTPNPATTDWVPMFPADVSSVAVPTVVNGQWLKGSGGAAVWAPITATDVPGALIAVRVFNTVGSSTYTPTPGTTKIFVEVLGGGGSGGGSAATTAGQIAAGGGGGAGGYAASWMTSGFAGTTLTVGAGAVAGAAGANGNYGCNIDHRPVRCWWIPRFERGCSYRCWLRWRWWLGRRYLSGRHQSHWNDGRKWFRYRGFSCL